jgi:alkylation response protein AidB-like acyl-CoA dehydrogenase
MAGARRFLDDHAPSKQGGAAWGHGDDQLSSYRTTTPEDEAQRVRAAKTWKALEFDHGYGWIAGAPELGGRGLPPEFERGYLELRAQYDVPAQNVFVISLGMVAPSFEQFGGEQVRTLVPRLWRGDLIGCQLFSEPTNGSDVAGLITKARADGDEWVIDGQKVWTSVAQHSQWGLLLARTNPDAPKHAGITAFALDMSSPGVEVRPLVMMTGGTEFNEVFLDGVRVPDSHRLGPVDGGWRVAIATLMNERALGAAGSDLFGTFRALERLRMTIEYLGAGRDPRVRNEYARLYTMGETIRYMAHAADERRRIGLPPGPAESVFKLANTEALRAITALGTRICGLSSVVDTGSWGTYAWGVHAATVPGMRIAGGTDEIMRNILAERVLGLPKEPS